MAASRPYGRQYISSEDDEPAHESEEEHALPFGGDDDDCLDDLAALLEVPLPELSPAPKPLVAPSRHSAPAAHSLATDTARSSIPRSPSVKRKAGTLADAADVPAGVTCRNCKATGLSGNFCNHCGTPLPAPAPTPLDRAQREQHRSQLRRTLADMGEPDVPPPPTVPRKPVAASAGSAEPPSKRIRIAMPAGVVPVVAVKEEKVATGMQYAPGFDPGRNQRDEVGFVEKNSGIRISQPVVSPAMLDSQLRNVNVIKLPDLRKIGPASHAQQWVVFGVIQAKSPPKDSSTGSKYLRFQLTDMNGTVVAAFAFGGAFDDCWKLEPGTLVCLAGATVDNKPMDNGKASLTLKLTQRQQVQAIGTAVDFGFCASFTRTGQRCTNPVNTAKGKHCEYHVKQEYVKVAAGRMDLNRNPTFAGSVSFSNQASRTRNLSTAGGPPSLLGSAAGLKKQRSPSAATPLVKALGATPELRQVVSQSKFMQRVHDQLERSKHADPELLATAAAFSVPVVPAAAAGSTRGRAVAGSLPGRSPPSLSEPALGASSSKATSPTPARSAAVPSLTPGGSTKRLSGLELLKAMQAQQQQASRGSSSQPKQAPRTEEELETEQLRLAREQAAKSRLTPLQQQQIEAKKRVLAELRHSERQSKQDRPAEASPSRPGSSSSAAALASPPVRKSPSAARSLVEEMLGRSSSSTGRSRPGSGSGSGASSSSSRSLSGSGLRRGSSASAAATLSSPSPPPAPPKPKSRLAQLMPELAKELESEEGRKQIMEAKSSHMDDLRAAQNHELDCEMERAEKVEGLQEQMEGITEQEVPAWSCRECCRVAWFFPTKCKEKQHKLSKVKAIKRWFRCGNCKQREWFLNQLLPAKACMRCGSSKWNKSSMMERETIDTMASLKVRNETHGTGLHYRYDGNTQYEAVEED